MQRLRWVLGLTGVAAVGLVAFTGYQALQARESLRVVATEFDQIAADLKEGDERSARANLTTARLAADEAEEHLRGPGWWLTSRLPGVGDDVRAVRTVADVTQSLVSQVLPDVLAASETLEPARLRPAGGRVSLAPVERVAPDVVAADREMQRLADRVGALDTTELNNQLAVPVSLMQRNLDAAATLSAKASYAVRLLPSMLGNDGPRRYLLLFQNNAEVRASGGIPGAFAVVRVDRGRITLGAQGSASTLGEFPRPVVPLSAAERDLYGEKLAQFPQNVNFTPDFPRSAQIAAAMWRQRTGTAVDGVLSVDPVALSYVLGGTGPVRVPVPLGDGGPVELTADNAVQVLLDEVYSAEPDPARQDRFFAAATRAVFGAVTEGAGDPAGVLAGVSRAAEEHRVLLWSADPAEQALLGETRLSGRVPPEPHPRSPYVGVFLNDGTGAKMQYYLDHRVDVRPVACNPEGRQELEVTVSLTSTASARGAGLPDYVVGMAQSRGLRPGHQRVNVHLYAPVEGWVEASTIDGAEQPVSTITHLGHEVATRTVDLAPGQTREVGFTVMGGLDQTGRPIVRVTPGVRSTGVGPVGEYDCDS